MDKTNFSAKGDNLLKEAEKKLKGKYFHKDIELFLSFKCHRIKSLL
jgi:hypothetical protein